LIMQPLAGSILDVFNHYKPFFAPVPQACGYYYNEPPCGPGNRNAFWNAVCELIHEAGLRPDEAAYVDQNFGVLGIHSTGCSNLNYAVLDQGITDGWNNLLANWKSIGTRNKNKSWRTFLFNGIWPATQDGFFARAVTYAMNTNDIAIYWSTFVDENNAQLNCKDTSYKVEWWKFAIPVDYSVGGFWSMTLYMDNKYMYPGTATQPNHVYSIRGRNPTPADFVISPTCDPSNPNCLPCPADGVFHLIFRGYAPEDGLQPCTPACLGTKYRMPEIWPCSNKHPC